MDAPYSWVRRVTSEVQGLNEIPLFGSAPAFDWKSFSSFLSSHLGVKDLSIHPMGQDFKEGDEIINGMGSNFVSMGINVSSLGEINWLMSEADMEKLTHMMIKSSNKTSPMPSELLLEGFYRYIALESLYAAGSIPPLNQFTYQITDQELNVSSAFCIDIQIKLGEKNAWGRLVLPMNFRKNWVQHFSAQPVDYVPSKIAEETFVTVGIKTGSVILHQDEIEELEPGDFILLDKGSYDASRGTGVCMLMLQSTPLFNAKIKQNKVELIDYAFYYEDNMEENPPPESPEIPESMEGIPSMGEPAAETKTFQAEEAESVAIKEMPLNVTVEIGRIRITLDQLMKLSPGNLLELPIHPDQSVSLTVAGQKIGSAELVYLGEQLGIRILEI